MKYLTKTLLSLFLVYTSFLLLISLVFHTNIATLQSWYGKVPAPFVISEMQGDLFEGQLQLGMQKNKPYQPLGRLSWHNQVNFLFLETLSNTRFQTAQSDILLSNEASLISMNALIQIQDGRLQLEDIMPLLNLDPEFGRWLQGMQGRLEHMMLSTEWVNKTQWLRNTAGSAELHNFSHLGETLPTVRMQLSQRNDDLIVDIQASELWQLKGQIVIHPQFDDANLLRFIAYNGVIEVKAENAESLPNWASLMKSTASNAAKTVLKGRVSLN